MESITLSRHFKCMTRIKEYALNINVLLHCEEVKVCICPPRRPTQTPSHLIGTDVVRGQEEV